MFGSRELFDTVLQQDKEKRSTELINLGYEPWLQKKENGTPQLFFGLHILKGKIALRDVRSGKNITLNVQILLGRDREVPTQVTQQQRDLFGEDATLFESLFLDIITLINRNSYAIGETNEQGGAYATQQSLTEIIDYATSINEDVPLTLVYAKGQVKELRHQIVPKLESYDSNEVVHNLRINTDHQNGQEIPVIYVSDNNTKMEFTQISNPGEMFLLYYAGEAVPGGLMPVKSRS